LFKHIYSIYIYIFQHIHKHVSILQATNHPHSYCWPADKRRGKAPGNSHTLIHAAHGSQDFKAAQNGPAFESGTAPASSQRAPANRTLWTASETDVFCCSVPKRPRFVSHSVFKSYRAMTYGSSVMTYSSRAIAVSRKQRSPTTATRHGRRSQ